jgi:hypothetical protein
MSTIDDRELALMIRDLEALAAAIASATTTIAPPPGLSIDADAWRRFATKLDGVLSLGDLSLAGKHDQLCVGIALEWNGEQPGRIRVSLGDSEAASEELRRITLSLPRPASDVLGEPDANALVESVTRWPDDITDLRVHDGVASAACASHDAERIRELVEMLRGVLIALSPATTPYR